VFDVAIVRGMCADGWHLVHESFSLPPKMHRRPKWENSVHHSFTSHPWAGLPLPLCTVLLSVSKLSWGVDYGIGQDRLSGNIDG
jgi:hypothetical protein